MESKKLRLSLILFTRDTPLCSPALKRTMLAPILLLSSTLSHHLHFHYSCEVLTATTLGDITRRRIIDGDVESGYGVESWHNVGETDESGKRQLKNFMQGLTYSSSIEGVLRAPKEASAVPEMETEARDVIDDMVMFREFAAFGSKLSSGSVREFKSAGSTSGLNSGTRISNFGLVRLNGRICRLISYENFFSKLDLKFPGVHLSGRSHTWGDIWVNQQTNAPVKATMREDLLGNLTLGDGKSSTPLNVLRRGELEMR